MREAAFLRQNAERWKQFEQLLSENTNVDPDQLADLFVRITDDLSYARTHYPKTNTTQYLNGLAGRIHMAIYRNRKERAGRIVTFWTREIPLVMYNVRRELRASFIVFLLSCLIGAFSLEHDTSFARSILSDEYVDTTLDNIEKGDPMGIYKDADQGGMFLRITINNVLVSFYAIAGGLLLSVGTVMALFRNGVLLGVFQYFFIQRGLGLESALTIWIHGTLEISAIIIAGAAGLTIGNSLLFPGTYTRKDSFMRGARNGVKVSVGLVPIFVIAGFLESFVTRHTEMPIATSLLIILGSLGFVLWYFVIYPHILNARITDGSIHNT